MDVPARNSVVNVVLVVKGYLGNVVCVLWLQTK